MAGERGRGTAGSADATAGTRTYRWAIDRVEEGTAAVEQDGGHVYEIPRFLIPADARDGDVLEATVTGAAAGEVTVSVRIDRAASAPPAPAKSSAKSAPKKRRGNDPGGDIVL